MITPESAEIMKLLGMGAAELDIPARYSMFDEVSHYFGNRPSARQKILTILAKTLSKDGLESVWRYVRLQNEKLDAIKSLNPEEFEDDISDELKHGALSLASMKRVERSIEKVKRSHKEENTLDNPKVQKAVNVESITKTFNVVKEINQALERYGN